MTTNKGLFADELTKLHISKQGSNISILEQENYIDEAYTHLIDFFTLLHKSDVENQGRDTSLLIKQSDELIARYEHIKPICINRKHTIIHTESIFQYLSEDDLHKINLIVKSHKIQARNINIAREEILFEAFTKDDDKDIAISLNVIKYNNDYYNIKDYSSYQTFSTSIVERETKSPIEECLNELLPMGMIDEYGLEYYYI